MGEVLAYGNGQSRDMQKRMVDLGRLPLDRETSPCLIDLRARCLAAIREMAAEIFPEHIEDPRPSSKELDGALLVIQKRIRAAGLSSVWCEKARLLARAAVAEQWARGQNTLFGRFRHISTRGEKPRPDGYRRLVNLPEAWTCTLSDTDVADLQARADGLDFRGAMDLFRDLRSGDAGVPAVQAEVLRAMRDSAEARFSCPVWENAATIQLHLDDRCVRGGRAELTRARDELTQGLLAQACAQTQVRIAAPVARGEAIPLRFSLPRAVAMAYADRSDQQVSSLAIELGVDRLCLRGVISRPDLAPPLAGMDTVLAEDFGFVKTSSMVVLRAKEPIAQDILDFVAQGPGKKAVKAYLSGHVSGDEVELLESRQLCGRNFLAAIKSHADKVDVLRSEIDRCYNRLDRIRKEINRCAGLAPEAFVPQAPEPPDGAGDAAKEQIRYHKMHARFFRLLAGIGKLKARRRAVHARVAAIKKNWFGFVGNAKVALAEKYDAAVISEDLTVLAIEKDDPEYKGRTFNRMINNGAKGQYIRRSDNKLKWRNIPRLKLPSFYSSTTDWRTGHVCKSQRRRSLFKALDGKTWDADLHAAEMLARWLFLKPLKGISPPSL